MSKQALYTISSTGKFIQSMIEKGWEYVQLREGVLGHGDCVLISPTERNWNYIIREVYLNSWSSAQTIRKCRKLSKAILNEIEKSREEVLC